MSVPKGLPTRSAWVGRLSVLLAIVLPASGWFLIAGSDVPAATAAQLSGFGLPAAAVPAHDPQSEADLLALGRELFFESRLSGDGSRSCASCHAPDKGFSDAQPLSRGYNHSGHFRNTPSLLALSSKSRLMWDGRYPAGRLHDVVTDMLLSPVTMNGDRQIIVERVRQLPALIDAWQRAFGEHNPPHFDGLVAALAAWSSSHGNGETAVDRARHGERQALSARARAGMALFEGRAGCVHCHSGAAFSDGKLHRLGVPENLDILRDPERTVSLLRHYAVHGAVHGAGHPMAARGDDGAAVWTGQATDRGRFATPTLRGVAQTAPYMHNGIFATLEEVVDFYDRGGGPGSELRPLELSTDERAALVAFLEALTVPMPAQEAPGVDNYATDAGAGR